MGNTSSMSHPGQFLYRRQIMPLLTRNWVVQFFQGGFREISERVDCIILSISALPIFSLFSLCPSLFPLYPLPAPLSPLSVPLCSSLFPSVPSLFPLCSSLSSPCPSLCSLLFALCSLFSVVGQERKGILILLATVVMLFGN